MIVLCRKPASRTSHPPPDLPLQPQSPTCHLLSLPAEIRTAIWELLLIQPHPESASPSPSSSSPPSSSPPHSRSASRSASPEPHLSSGSIHANILRTCRQCHREGEPILYGGNPFLAHASLLTALPSFLVRIRPGLARDGTTAARPVTAARLTRLVRRWHVHVRLDTDPRFTRAEAAEAFAGADVLVVEASQASYGTGDLAVLELFEDVRGVRSAWVRGSVGDGRYARWLEGRMMGREEVGVGGKWEGKGRERDVWMHANR